MNEITIQEKVGEITALKSENNVLSDEMDRVFKKALEHPNKNLPMYKILQEESKITNRINSSKLIVNNRRIEELEKEISKLSEA